MRSEGKKERRGRKERERPPRRKTGCGVLGCGSRRGRNGWLSGEARREREGELKKERGWREKKRGESGRLRVERGRGRGDCPRRRKREGEKGDRGERRRAIEGGETTEWRKER